MMSIHLAATGPGPDLDLLKFSSEPWQNMFMGMKMLGMAVPAIFLVQD